MAVYQLIKIATRILRAVPIDKHDEFLNWAISGMPIRTEVEKQRIIRNIKERIE